jgi:hypothetical protein
MKSNASPFDPILPILLRLAQFPYSPITFTLHGALMNPLVIWGRAVTLVIGLTTGMSAFAADPIRHPAQNWSHELTQRFYHTPEGTFLMPYRWADGLAKAYDQGTFAEVVREFGVLPNSAVTDLNPDGLPVGFVRDARNWSAPGSSNEPWLGITCAMCHTGELRANGHTIRVPGGSSPVQFASLMRGVFGKLAALPDDTTRFPIFATALGATDGDALKTQVNQFLDQHKVKAYLKLTDPAVMPFRHGPYRLDALTLGALNIALMSPPSPMGGVSTPPLSADVPVSYPAIWTGPWRENVQYYVAIHSPLPRNVIQAFSTSFVRPSGVAPHRAIAMKNLIIMEEWLRDLNPPAWPEEWLGAIDHARARKGRELFQQRCAECHNWQLTGPNPLGVSFIRTYETAAEKLGTDATLANKFRNANERMLLLQQKSNELIIEHFKAENTGPVERQQATLGKDNVWAIRSGYSSGPLDGTWATAPYLHNGSVPTLYDLLLPEDDRPKKFRLGSREFDPVKVGLKSEGEFEFDTSIAGNRNIGHSGKQFGTDMTDEERYAVIEYLKIARRWRLDGQ